MDRKQTYDTVTTLLAGSRRLPKGTRNQQKARHQAGYVQGT